MSDQQIIVVTPDQLRELIDAAVKKAVSSAGDGDKLLDPAGAAAMLAVDEEYLYRHAKKFPFTRKLGPRLLRFSRVGILKWIEAKKLGSV